MDSLSSIVPLLLGGIGVIAMVAMRARDVSGLWRTSSRFNATEDWTDIPQEGQEPAPMATPLLDWYRRAITPHLEAGESLEGFANGFFSPPRPRDWGVKAGLEQRPLLIAVTSQRILLFEMGYRTIRRSCFIEYRDLQFLIPPKAGVLGTSGKLRFGLRSGREYQVGFTGPLFSDEGMRQEQRLAAHLRSIAPQFASSPGLDARAA